MGLFNAKIMQSFKARSLPIFEGSICGKKYNFAARMFTFADSISMFAK